MENQQLYGVLQIQPAKFKNGMCPIDDIISKMKNVKIEGFYQIIIDQAFDKVTQAFTSKMKDKELSNKFVLIAHEGGADCFLAIDGKKNAQWWDVSISPQYIIAHTCNSAKILSHQTWKGKFNDWLGNDGYVWHSLDVDSGIIWPIFFKNLCQLFKSEQSCKEIKSNLSDLYWDSLYESDNVLNAEIFRTAMGRNVQVATYKQEFESSKK